MFPDPLGDSENNAEPAEPKASDKWIVGAFGALFFGLLGLEVLTDLTPARMAAVFFLVFWVPLTVLHEAGHAMMARCLGWKVDGVHLGFGRTWRTFSVGGIKVELKSMPIVGLVKIRPNSLKLARTKNALVYAAGPGIELLAAVLLIAAVGWETVIGTTDTYGISAIQAFCIAAAAGAFMNLLPFSSSPSVVTDGMGILMSPFLTKTHFQVAMLGPEIEGIEGLMNSGDVPMALRRLESLTAHFPNIMILHVLTAQCLAHLGKKQEGLLGLQAYVRTLDGPARQEGEHALQEFRNFLQQRREG